jgi:hypothetical protein
VKHSFLSFDSRADLNSSNRIDWSHDCLGGVTVQFYGADGDVSEEHAASIFKVEE